MVRSGAIRRRELTRSRAYCQEGFGYCVQLENKYDEIYELRRQAKHAALCLPAHSTDPDGFIRGLVDYRFPGTWHVNCE